MSSQSMDSSKGPNHQIVRVNGGANELDELFKAVIGPKDSQIPLSVPMRQRNFPASFFRPPDGSVSASHSRDSSLDASFSPPQPSGSPLNPSSPQQQNQLNGVPSALPINHSRAHSSPATLQQPLVLSAAMASAAQQQQSVHLRQHSYDIDHIPLPEGWDVGRTENGEQYFINHIEKKTQWEDPRRKLIERQLQQQLQQQTQPRLVVVSQNNINLNSNSNNAINNTNSSSTGNIAVASGPLPEGWEQTRTPSGETYFVDHKKGYTTWDDPRLPTSAQQQIRAQLPNGRTPPPPFTANSISSTLVAALQNMNTSGNSTTDAIRLQQQHQRTVLNLELERQRMRQRQNEIRQNGYLNKPSSLVDDNSSTNRLPPISSTGIDPFLGGNSCPLINDCHSRQESADSGLGLGPNYSLPNTPEDFLTIEDAINSGDDANNNISQSSANDLDMDSLQVSNLDLGTENMDSDDLVPSLPDDFNSTDLLSNVEAVEALLESNRDNIMTWL